MSEVLTLDIPDELAARARELARDSRRSIGDVVMSWIRSGADESNVESLSDDRLLVLCELHLPDSEPLQLSAPPHGEIPH